MRGRQMVSVVVLLAAAMLVVGGCGSAGGPSQALKVAGAGGGRAAHGHDHGQVPSGPPVAPRNGVLDMRVDELGPQDVVFRWKPGNLLLQPGEKVTLKVANNDDMQHNLQFNAAKVNQNLPVGKVTTITFTAPQAGTYVFWCKYHLQMMQGEVTVHP